MRLSKKRRVSDGETYTEQAVEEGVVVGQRLASGSGLGGRLARVQQVVVLLRSLLALNSGLLGGRALREAVVGGAGVVDDRVSGILQAGLEVGIVRHGGWLV